VKTRWKILISVVLALIAFGGWAVSASPPPQQCTFSIDLQKARALTAQTPGEKPSDIRFEHLAHFAFPGHMISASLPYATRHQTVFVYELRYPDRTIVLDSGMTEEQAKGMRGAAYDSAAAARLSSALDKAAAVYITHEHADHIGTVYAREPKANVHPLKEQLDNAKGSKPAVLSDAAKGVFTPLAYEQMTVLAPGLVAIKAPGHTPGSQWFFVTRADGKELLFVGDSAWQMVNVETGVGPPRVAKLFGIDLDATQCQLAWMHHADPTVMIVPGHDADRVAALAKDGLLAPGF
jgi:glyoxylase-like metal-dependent hydrolase (beta-lactamase superfamily II)